MDKLLYKELNHKLKNPYEKAMEVIKKMGKCCIDIVCGT